LIDQAELNRRRQPVTVSRDSVRSGRNFFLHAIYLLVYGLFKNFSIPLFNYARYAILRIFGARIDTTYVSDGVLIWFPWNVTIGRRSSLNQGVIIDGFGGVKIGEGVRIAAYTVINTADHDFSDPNRMICEQGFVVAGVTIEDDVWLGTGVIVNKGVTIGRGSVIGAGAVVTRDIPPYSIAVGVPCRVVGSRANPATHE